MNAGDQAGYRQRQARSPDRNLPAGMAPFDPGAHSSQLERDGLEISPQEQVENGIRMVG